MQLKRFIKSLLNNFLFIVNVILWIFNIKSVGELVTGIKTGKNRKENFVYGICTLVQYITYGFIIGFILTIYWWAKNEQSIAERLSNIKMK